MAKIQSLESTFGDGAWPITTPLDSNNGTDEGVYTVGSPTGSFGYGDYAVRIRLKDGVNFIENGATGCSELSETDAENSIIVNINTQTMTAYVPGFSYTEFIVCRAGVIHSWSYGTRPHYDEIVKDVQWDTGPGQTQDFLSYVRRNGKPLYIGNEVDQKDYTLVGLQRRLQEHLTLSLNSKGKIHISPDFRNDIPTAQAVHFSSKWSVYFHDH